MLTADNQSGFKYDEQDNSSKTFKVGRVQTEDLNKPPDRDIEQFDPSFMP